MPILTQLDLQITFSRIKPQSTSLTNCQRHPIILSHSYHFTYYHVLAVFISASLGQ